MSLNFSGHGGFFLKQVLSLAQQQYPFWQSECVLHDFAPFPIGSNKVFGANVVTRGMAVACANARVEPRIASGANQERE